MPFSAIHDGKIINLLRVDPEEYRGLVCKCKFCGKEMIVVNGEIVRAHFRHSQDSICSLSSEPESIDHLFLKSLVANILFDSETEKLIKAGNKKYEVDVLLDKKFAVECQVSPCQIDYVKEKTEAYLSVGLIPIWIFFTKRSYDYSESQRLNNVLKQCFLEFGQFYGNVYPLALLYSSHRESFLHPRFGRRKIADDFSPKGYHNEYYLNDKTVEIGNLLEYLRKTSAGLSLPPVEKIIKSADFCFLPLKYPCYEVFFTFEDNTIHSQKLYENNWGASQLEMYAGIKGFDNFFDYDLLFLAKENIAALSGKTAKIKSSTRSGLRYLMIDR